MRMFLTATCVVDGTCIMKDGSRRKLKEGEVVNREGKFFHIKGAKTGLPWLTHQRLLSELMGAVKAEEIMERLRWLVEIAGTVLDFAGVLSPTSG